MTMTDLTGPRVKLERALQQRGEILGVWSAWHQAGNIQVLELDNADGGLKFVIRLREPIPIAWAAIVGDLIHNLRASLDLLVHELVRETSGEAAWTAATGYPIGDSESRFKQLLRTRTAGASSSALEKIEATQAYPGGGQTGTALYRLHRLDIRDKHKLLAPVALRSRRFGVSPDFSTMGVESGEVPFVMIRPADQTPLTDGSVVLSVAPEAMGDVGIKYAFETELGIETEAPGEYLGIAELIEQIGKATQETVNAFAD